MSRKRITEDDLENFRQIIRRSHPQTSKTQLAQLLGISQSTLSKYRSQLNIDELGSDYRRRETTKGVKLKKIEHEDDDETSSDSEEEQTPSVARNVDDSRRESKSGMTRREFKAIHRLRKIRDSLDDENTDVEKLRKRLGKLRTGGFLDKDPDELLNSIMNN